MSRTCAKLGVLAVACMLGLNACTKWVGYAVPNPPAPMRTFHGTTRVTTQDQQMYELTNVVIATDSLFGVGADLAQRRYAMPLREVAKIEHQEKNPMRTLLTLGVVGFILFGFTDVFGGPFLR